MKGRGSDPEERQQGLFRPKENFQRSVLPGEGPQPAQECVRPQWWRAKGTPKRNHCWGLLPSFVFKILNTINGECELFFSASSKETVQAFP